MSLDELRAKIDEIDSAMAALFERRMALCAQIAEEKAQSGAPVFNPEREKAMLAACGKNVSPKLAPLYRELLEKEISLSKRYQRGLLHRLPENITVERGCLARIGKLFNLHRRVLLVTDSGVPAEYVQSAAAQCKAPLCVALPHGESTKSLDTMRTLYQKMLEAGFDRGDCVLALGGGMVGDIAGFAAACYMRGIDFYNVPTTLLAQVDSSVGGKTAANFCGVKNVLGAFHAPKAVAVDTDLLQTLDERQYKNGLAEAIKTAACLDEKLFFMFEHGVSTENIDEVIRRCIFAKMSIVEADEHESGARRVLNFGHTIGHAAESAAKGALFHGECVAMGMPPMCESSEGKQRLCAVLKKYGFELRFSGSEEAALAALEHDKKFADGKITAVVLKNIGEYEFVKMSICEAKKRLGEIIK